MRGTGGLLGAAAASPGCRHQGDHQRAIGQRLDAPTRAFDSALSVVHSATMVAGPWWWADAVRLGGLLAAGTGGAGQATESSEPRRW